MYKPGQGMSSRVGVLVVGAILSFYAGYSWFIYYTPFANTLGGNLVHHSFIVGMLIFLGCSAFMGHLAFVNPKSSDYLIDMDAELRKVVWPAVQPLFDPKTEAWGSTYVVIACTIIITAFIATSDFALQKTITEGLLVYLY